MKICFIGNYAPDKQESMQRFLVWVREAAKEKGIQTEELKPIPFFAKSCKTTLSGVGKWLGYLDKFVLFPIQLKKHATQPENTQTIYHIVDHSNACYANLVPKSQSLLTCHDVLAIRGGLGDPEAWCPASKMGTFLQKWILKHLQKAPHIAFVSQSTWEDLKKLPYQPTSQTNLQREVVFNGLNHEFSKTEPSECIDMLQGLDLETKTPYFFHLGSSLPRKNRIGCLKAFRRLMEGRQQFRFVFAGEAFSEEERKCIQDLSFETNDCIQHVGKVTFKELQALYSYAYALVFPSYSEGFGWPAIEAQACDCPVICGNKTSLPEVAGDAALLCNPYDIESIAGAMHSVTEPTTRAALIQKGHENLKRFSPKNTVQKYLNLYQTKIQRLRT